MLNFNKVEHSTIEPDLFQLMSATLQSQREHAPGKGSPLLLTSAPGLGKTAMYRALAKEYNLEFRAIILSRIPSADISGFFIPDLATGVVVHLTTKDIIDPEYDKEKFDGILILFDEIGNADVGQQTSIQSFVEDWKMGGVPVAENVFFAFASNRKKDSCGSNDLVKSLVDRLFVKDIEEPDVDNWIRWAMKNGVHPNIIGYIQWKKEALFEFDPKAPQGGQPSPRAWEKASHLIDSLPIETNYMISTVVSGKVGEVRGIEFSAYIRMLDELCSYEDVMRDPEDAPIPHHNTSACYAMCTNIAYEFAQKDKAGEDLTKEEVDAAITYIRRMDDAMAVFGFRMMDEATTLFSKRSDEFTKFKKDYKELG